MKLLKKEWKLCMHPMGYIMLGMSALLLVPGYPYGVSCFYMALAIYFICLSARENHDATYTLTLPVSRRDAVLARVLFCTVLELGQMISMALFIWVKNMIGNLPNPAGLDAGLAMIGEGFLLFALFNMVFFPLYYRDINKPGVAFLLGGLAMFLWIAVEVIGTYTVPLIQYKLDQPDPAFMEEKGLFTLGGAALFAAGTYAAALKSAKKFEKADLAL